MLEIDNAAQRLRIQPLAGAGKVRLLKDAVASKITSKSETILAEAADIWKSPPRSGSAGGRWEGSELIRGLTVVLPDVPLPRLV